MIKLRCRGNYNKTEKFLKECKDTNELRQIMERYGREGVAALSASTPVDTGETATSWSFEVIQEADGISLVFTNNSMTKTGIPIAILLKQDLHFSILSYILLVDHKLYHHILLKAKTHNHFL